MTRAARLLDLVQILRRHRRPVTGAALAGELGVSLRTLYRDVDTLRAQGAAIEGEAGLGYVLRSGFLMPPLMFSDEELEALVLGAQWVALEGDPRLATAGESALAKIAAVLPEDRRDAFDEEGLLVVHYGRDRSPVAVDAAIIRRALREEKKLTLRYRDERGRETRRTVWPLILGYFREARMLAAWCELRGEYRHFRLDRMVEAIPEDAPLPKRRRLLVAEWRRIEGIPKRR